MTCNTSAVAICCSNASRVSVRSRSDDRLSREILQQRDLLVCERPYFLPENSNDAEQGLVFAQRYGKLSTEATDLDLCSPQRMTGAVSLALRDVRDMSNVLSQQHPLHGHAGSRQHRSAPSSPLVEFAMATGRNEVESFSIISGDVAKAGLAQTHRFFEHHVEDGRKIAGRGVDDAKHLSGGGLLLQGFAGLGQQPRVLYRDDRLRSEVLDERDFPVAERPNFKADSSDHAEQRTVFAQWHVKTCPCAVRIADLGQIGDVDQPSAVD